jgi:hypothetical protein
MGGFLSPDNLPGTPLNPRSFNLYAYVHGNPVNYNDPTGHWAGGLPPGQRYDNGDPFGGLNIPASGGDPGNSVVDALLDRIPNPAQQANTQPAAQDTQQDPKPTAGQEGEARPAETAQYHAGQAPDGDFSVFESSGNKSFLP